MMIWHRCSHWISWCSGCGRWQCGIYSQDPVFFQHVIKLLLTWITDLGVTTQPGNTQQTWHSLFCHQHLLTDLPIFTRAATSTSKNTKFINAGRWMVMWAWWWNKHHIHYSAMMFEFMDTLVWVSVLASLIHRYTPQTLRIINPPQLWTMFFQCLPHTQGPVIAHTSLLQTCRGHTHRDTQLSSPLTQPHQVAT